MGAFLGSKHWSDRIARALQWRGKEMMRHWSDEIGRARYGLQRRVGAVKTMEGKQRLSGRVAIYTIFPTNGIQNSHHATVEALADCEYATLMVSNLPLTSESRAELAKKVWRIIERPNFGYDFGAYREGVRSLAPSLTQLQRLIFCNDSVWFPLPGAMDWPLRAEATGCDLVGAVSNGGIVTGPEATCGASWIYDPTLPDFHYCSFALSLGPAALRSEAFEKFWEKLRLTDNKLYTVKRGEVGFSRALIAAGLSHAETFDIQSLGKRIMAMTAPDLHQFISEIVIPEDYELEVRRTELLERDLAAQPRAELVAEACHMVASTGPAYALPAFAYDVLQHPFLKKSPLRLLPSGAAATLRLTERLPGALGQAIHAEATALAARAMAENG